MRKRIMTPLLLTVCLLFSGVVLAKAPIKITNVTGWGGLPYEQYEAMIKRFNNLQNEVEVELIYGGSEDEAAQKVQAMIASGNSPDLYEMGAQYLANFADAGVIVSVEERIKNDPDVTMDDFYQSQIDQWTYNGQMYTMPWYASVPIWVYNKDMFREKGIDVDNLPRYWDEFLPVLQAVTVQDSKQPVTGVVWTRTLWYYRIFLNQGGGKLLNKNNGREGLSDAVVFDEYIAGLEFWSSLQAKYDVAKYLPRGQLDLVFLGGKSASALVSTSNSQQLLNDADFEIGFAPVPFDRERGQRLPMGAISLGMFKTTPEREDATWKFLKWLNQPEQRAEWTKNVGNQSPSKKTVEFLEEEGFFDDNPHQKMFAEQLEQTIPDPVHPRFPDIYTIFVDTVEPVFLGQIKLEDSLRQGKIASDRVLTEYKEQLGK